MADIAGQDRRKCSVGGETKTNLIKKEHKNLHLCRATNSQKNSGDKKIAV